MFVAELRFVDFRHILELIKTNEEPFNNKKQINSMCFNIYIISAEF